MTTTAWPYRWFGFWKELGRGYETCPSIHDFRRNPETRFDANEVQRTADYLDRGAVVVSTSRRGFPCVICGRVFTGSLSFRTDGVWLWRDDLTHYIVDHDIVLPAEFLAHIRQNDFTVPHIETVDRSKLQFPA